MPFLETRGCHLYYETHGQGPALVFAHGLGGSHLAWWQDRLVDEFLASAEAR